MTLLKESWNSTTSFYDFTQKQARHLRASSTRLRGLILNVVCTALLLTLTFVAAWAQSTATGTVSGLVTDPSNAVIVGASVKLTDTSTNTSRDTTTNDAGRFIFVNVTPGTYDIKISKTGFAQAVVSHVTVEIGQVSAANAVLKVGAATETV